MNVRNKKLRYITTAAVIAAIYASLTLMLATISYGPVQIRISEFLTVLPYFTPAAVPGLFIGCILSNLASPLGPVDIAVGSIATLIAAFLTRKMPTKWLAPLPPVICNGLIVGAELHFLTNAPFLPTLVYVSCGEAAASFIGGYILIFALEKSKAGTKLFGARENENIMKSDKLRLMHKR